MAGQQTKLIFVVYNVDLNPCTPLKTRNYKHYNVPENGKTNNARWKNVTLKRRSKSLARDGIEHLDLTKMCAKQDVYVFLVKCIRTDRADMTD